MYLTPICVRFNCERLSLVRFCDDTNINYYVRRQDLFALHNFKQQKLIIYAKRMVCIFC